MIYGSFEVICTPRKNAEIRGSTFSCDRLYVAEKSIDSVVIKSFTSSRPVLTLMTTGEYFDLFQELNNNYTLICKITSALVVPNSNKELKSGDIVKVQFDSIKMGDKVLRAAVQSCTYPYPVTYIVTPFKEILSSFNLIYWEYLSGYPNMFSVTLVDN